MLCRFLNEGGVNTGFGLRVFDVASGGGRKVGRRSYEGRCVGSASMVARNGLAYMPIGKMQTL